MRNKILESEVFKLYGSGKPKGIFRLIPGPGIKLSKGEFSSSYIRVKNLSKMVDGLAYELSNWHNETHIDNDLLSKINELSLKGSLLDIGIYTSLGKQLPAMIRKINKETKKRSNIKVPRSIESAIKTRILIDLFNRYTDFNDNDVKKYIAHLLHYCEIEEGTPLQILNRLRQSYYRTLRKINKVSLLS